MSDTLCRARNLMAFIRVASVIYFSVARQHSNKSLSLLEIVMDSVIIYLYLTKMSRYTSRSK